MLLRFLELKRHAGLLAGKTILEVGCGTGLVGLGCVQLGAARAILTDLGEVCEKVTLKAVAMNPAIEGVEVAELDWGSVEEGRLEEKLRGMKVG